MKIPFNKPFFTGKEMDYMQEALAGGKISGNGVFTKKCQKFLEETFGFGKCLLTSSCTDALEMSALLLDLKPGDEVIMPSYTFVSTANAFVLRGAKLVFADSREDHPGMDENKIEHLVTSKTKAIVVVHYAGVATDMEKILSIAEANNLFVIEDAAQAIESYYTFHDGTKKPLGTIGSLSAFSFHETKNIISGEGGLLALNDSAFFERSEIIWEKGTNRSAFFRGEVDKYGWVDVGSSFLPSDLTAAFLFAQLENMERIQKRRLEIWNTYDSELKDFCETKEIRQPFIPDYATNNAHMYYLVCKDRSQRDMLIAHLKKKEILSVFHYQSLHSSKFYHENHDGRELRMADFYTERLLRLPLYFELDMEKQQYIIDSIYEFEE